MEHSWCFCRGKGAKLNSCVVIPEEPREIFVQGAELVSAVSQAVCVAGAHALGVPVYQHIASIYNPEVTIKVDIGNILLFF